MVTSIYEMIFIIRFINYARICPQSRTFACTHSDTHIHTRARALVTVLTGSTFVGGEGASAEDAALHAILVQIARAFTRRTILARRPAIIG